METGRREKAQCQSGQLDGNKAVVDGDAVDPHVVKQSLFLCLSTQIHIHNVPTKQNTHTHTLAVTR